MNPCESPVNWMARFGIVFKSFSELVMRNQLYEINYNADITGVVFQGKKIIPEH